MIISASRRTDIPAFYGDWLMNRLREGYCVVPHPMKPQVVFRVSLKAEDVDAIVFWTKHPKTLLPHLDEIASRGYRFMFLYTVTPYGPPLETQLPPLEDRIQLFQEVSKRIGANRVVWRYDPIIISNRTDEPFHLDGFEKLSARLEGLTRTVIVSFVDFYGFVTRRLAGLRRYDLEVLSPDETAARAIPLAEGLREIASRYGMEIQSCAEERDLQKAGISPGSCIDGRRLQRLFGGRFPTKKDPGQRKKCLCTISKDIGVYDTCGHQCVYCYATRNLDLAAQRCASHNPSALSLVGHLSSDRSH
jgi:DNA repair photolyase